MQSGMCFIQTNCAIDLGKGLNFKHEADHV